MDVLIERESVSTTYGDAHLHTRDGLFKTPVTSLNGVCKASVWTRQTGSPKAQPRSLPDGAKFSPSLHEGTVRAF